MAHIKMLASVDVHIDPAAEQCLSSLELTLNVFVNLDAFIDDITGHILEPDSVILITSSSLGQMLLPMIDFLPQLRSIYIYSMNENQDIYWAEKCSKIGINRVFSQKNDLIVQLTIDLKENNELHVYNRIFVSTAEKTPTINVVGNVKCNNSTRDLTDEKVTFLWVQLLNDMIIGMPQFPTISDDMLNVCRSTCANDARQLSLIEKFQNTYKPEDAINWYTQETFLYRLLNQALRTQDSNDIFQFRLIIIDLHRQLNQLFQSSTPNMQRFTVYRGQRMSYSEIEKLRNNTSGLISWNSFVSTTLNETRANRFAQKGTLEARKETIAVKFELILDSEVARTTNKPFADISGQSRYASEAEVLLSMGTVFRLDKVELSSSDMWTVTATMCTFLDDPELKPLYNYAKAEVRSRNRLTYSAYGKFLSLMSDFDSAVQHLTNLLPYAYTQSQLNYGDLATIHHDLATIHHDLATIHHDLAYAYRESGQSAQALKQYEIALDLTLNCVPVDEIDVANILSDMGWLLMIMNDLKRARGCHEKALTIRMRDFEHNPADVAMSLNCLGSVYIDSSELYWGKQFLDKALQIREQCLPSLHPFIAMSYSSLGAYFDRIDDDDRALKMFEKALEIYKSSMPPSHQLVGSSHSQVAWLYLKQKRWLEAIDSFKAALTCNHRRIDDIECARIFIALAQAYEGLKNYQEAFTNYQQALTLAINLNDQKLMSKVTKSIEEIQIYI